MKPRKNRWGSRGRAGSPPVGIVYLVGAGPGDPGLMTLKGLECLRLADVVVYDYLANKVFLDRAPPAAKKIYVGKKGAFHSKEQEEINRLLIAEARRGRVVVRLKGGDPFVFGRGGEEAEALAAAGVPFEIVPGVTSAIAVPAYAGIPITHRDFASAVTFVTGHEKDLLPSPLPQSGTIVFLMGWANLPRIVEDLKKSGRDPKTPMAMIEWGTWPRQKTAVGTLETIVAEVSKKNIRPPTITVAGEVVALRDKISWFEKRPLFGKKILVTRSRTQASELSRRLEEMGAQVFEIPTIEILPPTSWFGMDRAIRTLSKQDWVVFTSANGVESFFGRILKKADLRALGSAKIAAIGPATSEAICKKGVRVDFVAGEFKAEGLLRKFSRQKIGGKRVLLVQAKEGREILREGLAQMKAKIKVVEAYRTVLPKQGARELRDLLEKEKIDLITFASSSAVENFVKMVGPALHELIQKIPAAAIGPITAALARNSSLRVVVQPKAYTIPTLVEAIARYFSIGLSKG